VHYYFSAITYNPLLAHLSIGGGSSVGGGFSIATSGASGSGRSRWMGKTKGARGSGAIEKKRKIKQRYEKIGRNANRVRAGGVLGLVDGKVMVMEKAVGGVVG